MKRQIILFFIGLSFLGGCSKGHVGVDSENKDQGAGPVQVKNQPEGPKPVKSEKATSVIFHSFDADRFPQVNPRGLGFLSSISKTTTAFVFPYSSSSKALLDQSFVPWLDGVAYIKSIDPSRDAITFSQLPNLDSEEIYTHTSHIVSVSGSEDFQWLSWVDDHGEIYLWHAQTKNISHLTLPSLKGTSVQIVPKANSLVIMAQNFKNPNSPIAETLLFNLSETPGLQKEILSRSGALDPNGQWLALVEPVQILEALTVQNLVKPEEKYTIAQVSQNSVAQISWSSLSSLAYWIKDGDRKAQLRVAEIAEQKSYVVANIQFPTAIQMEKIICPHWKRNDLYYGGFADGKYSIFKATKKSGVWYSRVFAKPSRDSEGYGCPTVTTGVQ